VWTSAWHEARKRQMIERSLLQPAAGAQDVAEVIVFSHRDLDDDRSDRRGRRGLSLG